MKEQILKLLEETKSSNRIEVYFAIHRANQILEANGTTWRNLLSIGDQITFFDKNSTLGQFTCGEWVELIDKKLKTTNEVQTEFLNGIKNYLIKFNTLSDKQLMALENTLLPSKF